MANVNSTASTQPRCTKLPLRWHSNQHPNIQVPTPHSRPASQHHACLPCVLSNRLHVESVIFVFVAPNHLIVVDLGPVLWHDLLCRSSTIWAANESYFDSSKPGFGSEYRHQLHTAITDQPPFMAIYPLCERDQNRGGTKTGAGPKLGCDRDVVAHQTTASRCVRKDE